MSALGQAIHTPAIRRNALATAREVFGKRMRFGPPLMTQEEGRAVHARTSFIVARIMHTGETMLFATGRYHDHIVLDDGGSRFSEKIVILDSRLIDTLLAIPL